MGQFASRSLLCVTGDIGPSSVRVEPVLSSSGDHTVEKVTESGIIKEKCEFCTLITPAGNRADVATPLESIKAISEQFFNTAYGFFLVKRVAYTVGANYVRNTWVKYGQVKPMLNSSNELFFFQFSSLDGFDAMLENEDVGNVPVWVKLYDVPMIGFSENGLSVIATKLHTHSMLDSFTSDICMQSWGRSTYARAMIELRADDKCPKNIGSDVAKNLKNPSHAPRGVPVGPKVRNPNPFDVLNSVENDVDLGTNGGTSNSASKEANSSGFALWNVGSSSISTTPISDHDSEDEVEPIDNEMTSFLDSKSVGYSTNSLLEQ
ncbi:hypothetical protein Tco_0946949 [Tanacetum coccineum]